MLKSLLAALGTSALVWLSFSAFAWVSAYFKQQSATHFSVSYLYAQVAVQLLMWAVFGVLAALLLRPQWLSGLSPLVYLLMGALFFYISIRYPLPFHSFGMTVYPPISTVYGAGALAGMSAVLWLAGKRRK